MNKREPNDELVVLCKLSAYKELIVQNPLDVSYKEICSNYAQE